MGGRSGCFDVVGFFIMVVAILMVFMLVVGAVGSSPVLDATGLHWDNTGRDIRETNYTQRFIADQEGQTERARILWDAVKGIAVAAAIASVLIVLGIQRGRTMRHQAQMQAYIAAVYPQAQIEQRNGAVVLVDYGRHEVITIDAVKAEMKQLTVDYNQL